MADLFGESFVRVGYYRKLFGFRSCGSSFRSEVQNPSKSIDFCGFYIKSDLTCSQIQSDLIGGMNSLEIALNPLYFLTSMKRQYYKGKDLENCL